MSLCDIFPDDPSCGDIVPLEGDSATSGLNEDSNDVNDGSLDESAAETGIVDGDEDVEPKTELEMHDGYAGESSYPFPIGEWTVKACAEIGKWNRVKRYSTMAMINPMMSHLQFFGVASSWAAASALMAFRYRSASTFYDAGKIGSDSNYWKLSDQLRLYSGVGVGGVLALTSLMGAFGMSPKLNAMAWMILGAVTALLDLAIMVIRFLGYDAAYKQATGTNTTNASAGTNLMTLIKSDMIMDGAFEIAALLTLASAKEGIGYAVWNSLTDQEQADKIAEWSEPINERTKQIKEDRAAMATPEKKPSEKKTSDETSTDEKSADEETPKDEEEASE